MAFFSAKNSNARIENKGIPERSSPREEEKTENAPSYAPGVILLAALVYVLCFTFLLSFSYQAGKYIEYRIPLFLMEAQVSLLMINTSVLTIAVLSAFVLQLSLGIARASTPLGRSRRISYFFSVLATLAVAVYLGIVILHSLRGGRFLFQSLYIVVLYIAVFIPHFKAGKSPLAHSFVAAGFIVLLIVTAFYTGIASAKIEDKLVTSINGETYALGAVQKDKMIFSGFDTRKSQFDGRLLILNPDSNSKITFTRIPSIRKQP